VRRCRALALAIAATTALLSAGCSPAPGPDAAAGPQRLADCNGKPDVRPAVVIVRCADDSLVARDLKWAGWGTPVATATGLATVNTFEFIDCHTGAYASYRIVLIASGELACPKGGPAYARLQTVIVGPFHAWPSGAINQIIARPCGNVGAPQQTPAAVPTSGLK
jgi:hypothetical protein